MYPMMTTRKSSQFQAFRRYVFFPTKNPWVMILSTASMVNRTRKMSSAMAMTCCSAELGSVSYGSSAARNPQLATIKVMMIRSNHLL